MVKVIVAFALGLCFGVHRNVIKSLMAGSPLPKAPAWHFWVKSKDKI